MASAAPAVPFSPEDHEEFLECARYGELEDIKSLLAEGINVNYRDESGITALHRAAGNGHVEVAVALLDAGAVHGPNSSGNTPLHWACLLGHSGVVEVLLARATGIEIFAKNAAGRSALTEAASSGHEELARSLLFHSSAEPPEDAGIGEASDDDNEDDNMEDGEADGTEEVTGEDMEGVGAAGGGGGEDKSTSGLD
jgi:ankyrin repeat protein